MTLPKKHTSPEFLMLIADAFAPGLHGQTQIQDSKVKNEWIGEDYSEFLICKEPNSRRENGMSQLEATSSLVAKKRSIDGG